MKKLVTVIVLSLFFVSFIAAGITSKAISNGSEKGNDEQNMLQSNTENEGEDANLRNRVEAQLSDDEIKAITADRNRIRERLEGGECPEKCTCEGSVTKCQLRNGTREMTVRAGNSGNIIIQVKDANASTKVMLYKSDDGKLYGVFRNNETKRVRLLPDQVQERVRERVQAQLENEEIVLNEDGTYQYTAQKRARLFGIIPVRERVQAQLNPETGELVQVRNAWWGFLASDEKAEPLLGAGCGTVTPGENDACCMNKGYDMWNNEAGECQFNAAG